MQKLALCCCFLLLFSQCETNEEKESLLKGKWNVVEIMGGFMPSKFYEDGDITWTLNENEKTITVLNTITSIKGLYEPNFKNNLTGTYSYNIIEEEENSFLLVEQAKGNIIEKEDGVMIDFGIAHDDIAYVLKKVSE
ncbi:hypothetical protein N9V96_02500 [Polaribacter sp.]|nr:hypothetical protein [Polaribacter sp.]